MAIPRYARGRGDDDDMPVYGGSSNRSGSTDKKKPIGVPDDYTIPYRRPHSPPSSRLRHGMAPVFGAGHGATTAERAQHNLRGIFGSSPSSPIGERRPQYHEGDEFLPATLGPASIGELQAAMQATGILGGGFRYGVWDEASRNAYKDLLAEANAAGISVEDAINMRAQSFDVGGSGGGSDGGSDGGGGGGQFQIGPDGQPVWTEEQYVPPPLELRTTNKDDLRRVFRAAVIDTMGQGWSQAQINEIVDAYNWEEIRVQKEAYDQQVGIERAEFMGERPEGGEVISSAEIASPETFLDKQMQEKDPVGYQTGQVVNEVMPDFWQMMEGWS